GVEQSPKTAGKTRSDQRGGTQNSAFARRKLASDRRGLARAPRSNPGRHPGDSPGGRSVVSTLSTSTKPRLLRGFGGFCRRNGGMHASARRGLVTGTQALKSWSRSQAVVFKPLLVKQFLEMAQALGYVLRTKAEGWRLFCERMGVPTN